MDDTVEVIKYRGHNIKIYQDTDPHGTPREWDNLGTMICCHRDYMLGDKQFHHGDVALYETLCELGLITDRLEDDHHYGNEKEFIEKAFDKLDKHAIVLPLYLYDHSGITMNTTGFSCRWDSGQVGFIYVTLEDVRKEYGKKRISKKLRSKVIECLKAEVKCYDMYLTGEIYGFMVEPTDENKEISCDDSCWGYYGHESIEDVIVPEAKASIDHAINEYKEKVKANKRRKKEMERFYGYAFAL